jgi:hypothetical protein
MPLCAIGEILKDKNSRVSASYLLDFRTASWDNRSSLILIIGFILSDSLKTVPDNMSSRTRF